MRNDHIWNSDLGHTYTAPTPPSQTPRPFPKRAYIVRYNLIYWLRSYKNLLPLTNRSYSSVLFSTEASVKPATYVMLDASPSNSSSSRWTNGWRMLQFWRCQTSKGKALNRIIKQTNKMKSLIVSQTRESEKKRIIIIFLKNFKWKKSDLTYSPVRIHVPYTAGDVISFKGQGQLCRLTCAVRRDLLNTLVWAHIRGKTQKQTNTQTKNIKSWPENSIEILFHYPPALPSI